MYQKNYSTYNLELVAIVFALTIWRHYLYGEKCHIFTNHKSLKYIMSQKKLSSHQRRWLELLKYYDLIINNQPGKANIIAYALSRKSLFALRVMNTHLIREVQKRDIELIAKREQVKKLQDTKFHLGADDCLYVRNRLCVPRNS
ncbi:integrase [Gossypium australe]|uniref:Integrase n=1 Tax=Gossypium australe TaxID=47621 RepID=A0A5B6VCP3_9ROSI|nr:integrase [Gossypium australe]